MRWALDTDQLRSIEIGLRSKLRASQLSESFIDRHSEDLLQQAVTEYAKTRERGVNVTNPCGWIVHTAHRRAIDQLRREQHETGGSAEDIAADATDQTTPLPDEEALSHIEAEELHRAMSRLSVPQRQALSLYYFEDQTTRDGAEALGWSEPTFRRRRDAALRSLRKRFGVPVPEFDIGLAAWLSLSASESRFGWITGHIDGTIETARSSAVAIADRTREFATRLLSSGGGETAVGIGSPASKAAAGVCATAIAACTATGVIGPGLAGVDLINRETNPKPVVEKRLKTHSQRQARPGPVSPAPTIADNRLTEADSQKATRRQNSTSKSRSKERSRQANQTANSQFSVESSAPSSSAPSTPSSPPASTPSASASSPTPDQSAQQQFGLP
ncbi:MAG: sigma-70 family RNA polymerase sigma factor [Solirubrobacterales bacterium]|nr:sigma-70 family RNA polymerase sigma factor [Solirubrobacterales bacterium]